jgi:uncharacterized alpha-E superfamily protein
MLCRVADSLFWMSRYLERAENQARFIDVTLNIALGYRGSEDVLWSSLLHAGSDVESFKEHYTETTRENVIQYLLFDRRNLNSVSCCLAAARENARAIKENLTTEYWESINRQAGSLWPRHLAVKAGTFRRLAHCWKEPTRHRAFWM